MPELLRRTSEHQRQYGHNPSYSTSITSHGRSPSSAAQEPQSEHRSTSPRVASRSYKRPGRHPRIHRSTTSLLRQHCHSRPSTVGTPGRKLGDDHGSTATPDPLRPTPTHPLTCGFRNPAGQGTIRASFGTKRQWVQIPPPELLNTQVRGGLPIRATAPHCVDERMSRRLSALRARVSALRARVIDGGAAVVPRCRSRAEADSPAALSWSSWSGGRCATVARHPGPALKPSRKVRCSPGDPLGILAR